MTSAWEVLKTQHGDSVLQATFTGQHHCTHGGQMLEFMKSIPIQKPVSAIVVNLLDHDYEFGNDVAGLFLVGFERANRRMRPVCILAQGLTRASL